MMDDARKGLSQLVKINRTLAREVDAGQRAAAEAGRERDALRAQVESLKSQVRNLTSLDIAGELKGEIDNMKNELDRSRRGLEQIHREREAMLHDVQEARERAELAEQKYLAVGARMREMKRERDHLAQQLEESCSAMDEIRRRLVMSVEESPFPDGLN